MLCVLLFVESFVKEVNFIVVDDEMINEEMVEDDESKESNFFKDLKQEVNINIDMNNKDSVQGNF